MWIKATPTLILRNQFIRLFLAELNLFVWVEKKSMHVPTFPALTLQAAIRRNSAVYFQVASVTVCTWH